MGYKELTEIERAAISDIAALSNDISKLLPKRTNGIYLEQVPYAALFLIPALGAYAILIKSDAAKRTTVNRSVRGELLRSSIYATGEGQLHDIELILKQVIYDLNHALYGHGLLGYHQSAVRECLAEVGLEGCTLHGVLRSTILNAGLLIYIKDSGQERVIFAENERMVEVLEYVPCHLLNLIAGISHINALVDGFFYFDSQHASVAMQILSLTFESIEAVSILEI